jgi:hypothetical protein
LQNFTNRPVSGPNWTLEFIQGRTMLKNMHFTKNEGVWEQGDGQNIVA